MSLGEVEGGRKTGQAGRSAPPGVEAPLAPDQGSVFTVRLPWTRVDAPKLELPNPSNAKTVLKATA